MLRPAIKIPLWAAVGLPAAAYVWRSANRGWDFHVDATDVLLGILLLVLVGLSAIARRINDGSGSQRRDDDLSSQVNDEDDQA